MIKFNINNFNLNKWYHFTYKNDDINSVFNLEQYLLAPSVNSFINQIINPISYKGVINNDMRINIIIKFTNGSYFRSLTPVKTLEINNINELQNILSFYYQNNHAENYNLEDFQIFNFNL